MRKKQSERERFNAEMRETAHGLRRIGVISDATFAIMTARDPELDAAPKVTAPSGPEIVAMRKRAKMSKAAFARSLNVGVSTLDQWEREETRPRGPAAKLLAIVQQRGIEALDLEPAQ